MDDSSLKQDSFQFCVCFTTFRSRALRSAFGACFAIFAARSRWVPVKAYCGQWLVMSLGAADKWTDFARTKCSVPAVCVWLALPIFIHFLVWVCALICADADLHLVAGPVPASVLLHADEPLSSNDTRHTGC